MKIRIRALVKAQITEPKHPKTFAYFPLDLHETACCPTRITCAQIGTPRAFMAPRNPIGTSCAPHDPRRQRKDTRNFIALEFQDVIEREAVNRPAVDDGRTVRMGDPGDRSAAPGLRGPVQNDMIGSARHARGGPRDRHEQQQQFLAYTIVTKGSMSRSRPTVC